MCVYGNAFRKAMHLVSPAARRLFIHEIPRSPLPLEGRGETRMSGGSECQVGRRGPLLELSLFRAAVFPSRCAFQGFCTVCWMSEGRQTDDDAQRRRENIKCSIFLIIRVVGVADV